MPTTPSCLHLFLALFICSIFAIESHGKSSLEAGRELLGEVRWQFDPDADESTISCVFGHYPPPFCTTANVALNHETKVFTVYSKDSDMEFANKYLFRMAAEPMENYPHCDQTIDEAYLFTFYFYFGQSNYFHLHKDTLFPIFSLLNAKRNSRDAHERGKPVVLMPVVEKTRMAEINWDSGAFDQKYLDKYFILILEALAGRHPILPLDSGLTARYPKGFTCFRKAFFGAPSVRNLDNNPTFMKQFVSFMLERLDVERGQPSKSVVGLIKRAGRRRILNEEELINAASHLVDIELVEFSGMTIREQVRAVQKYTVLIGMNGAGFMNGIYLPEGAVAVQLAPFNATMLNVKEFGEIVAARGPYLVWRNQHGELSRPVPHDVYNSQSDTFVKVDEFVSLVREALSMGINKKLWQDPEHIKTEL